MAFGDSRYSDFRANAAASPPTRFQSRGFRFAAFHAEGAVAKMGGFGGCSPQ